MACSLNPTDARLWVDLGWYQYESGDLDAAIASNDRALLGKRETTALFNAGLYRAIKGNSEQARSYYDPALANARSQDREAAAKDVKEAIRRYPWSAPLLRQVQGWLAVTGQEKVPGWGILPQPGQ